MKMCQDIKNLFFLGFNLLFGWTSTLHVCPTKNIFPCRCEDYTGNGTYGLFNCWLPQRVPVSDAQMSEMLDLFYIDATANNIVPLRRMNVPGISLTRVPEQIRHLDQLNWLDLSFNQINSIRNGEFNFTAMLRVLRLSNNNISLIEDGAFQGNYGFGSKIELRNNKLKHFNASTFQTILEKIAENSGYPFAYIDITGNPIDCEEDLCHLAWLIRDNRYLLKAIESGAACSNSVRLNRLDPNGFGHCSPPSNATSKRLNIQFASTHCLNYQSILPCVCEDYTDGSVGLYCEDKALDDARTSEILNTFISTSNASLLKTLNLNSNSLTKVPKEMLLFPQLDRVTLSKNQIHSIKAISFKFVAPLKDLYLDGNQLVNFERGAIKGKFGFGSQIKMVENNVTRFEARIYKPLLEKLASHGEYEAQLFIPDIIDCSSDPCHLSWLIRDNRHLMNVVYFGRCSNKTWFSQLKQSAYSDCPYESIEYDYGDDHFDETTNIIGAVITVIFFIFLFVSSIAYKRHQTVVRSSRFRDRIYQLRGNVSRIDPNVPLDEQTDFIPYARRWEFPINRIQLERELGSGCFGRVCKAKAIGLTDDEPATTVAVKFINEEANEIEALKILVQELKILNHIGSNLNVVNLLGACTKSIFKGDLMIIIEYCRYGNLHSYLVKHRHTFVNQVNRYGKYLLVQQQQDNDLPNQVTEEIFEHDGYLVPDQNVSGPPHTNMPEAEYQHDGATWSDVTVTESGDIQLSDNSIVTQNNGEQPEWRMNYQQDDELSATIRDRIVATRDLICWSFQIARAMDFLGSKKVVHGDLATHNVLLTDDNIVKVADFGFARKIYQEYKNTKPSEQEKLPYKWMALESLTDWVFSTQTDVWSFGVVLWELFSLSAVPYPMSKHVGHLIRELKTGYRMPRAFYASNDLHSLMTMCWHEDPKQRPTFRYLEEAIRGQLRFTPSLPSA